MPDNEKAAMLLDDLAALDPSQRREVAEELRKVAETFAGVPDGRHTAHTLGLVAHMLDPSWPAWEGTEMLVIGPALGRLTLVRFSTGMIESLLRETDERLLDVLMGTNVTEEGR